jgi:hypothetical protein
MAWAKVDDGWWCHPKVIGLSSSAKGVWISALSWSCAQRLDEIPRAFLAIAYGCDRDADELVGAGLWTVTDAGWRIYKWAEYQEYSLSEKRAAAGRKGGSKSAPTSTNGQANAKQAASKEQASGKQTCKQGPIPSLPNPSTNGFTVSSTGTVDNYSEVPVPVSVVKGIIKGAKSGAGRDFRGV